MASPPGQPPHLPDDEILPPRLREHIAALYRTPRVPPHVDAKVLSLTQSHAATLAARRAQVRQRQTGRPLRWVGAGAAAAAAIAAAIVVAVKLSFNGSEQPSTGPQARLPQATAPSTQRSATFPADVAPAPAAVVDAKAGDVNRNGSVDILDAFELAKKIEAAQTRGPRWEDVNGDGVLDRSDVDRIAHMAVRIRNVDEQGKQAGGGNIQ